MLNAEGINFLKTYGGLLWAVISFVGGLFIGNWLAISRDRRKEWNDLTRESFKGLLQQIESNGQNGGLEGDLVIIETYIPIYKKFFYKRRLHEFLDSQVGRYEPYDPIQGSVEINHKQCEIAAGCAKKLLPYFKPR